MSPTDLLEEISGQDLLISSASIFAPQLTESGDKVFTALVRPQADGRLLVCAYLGGDDIVEGAWVIETLGDPLARSMAAELSVIAAGGGLA